MHRPRLFFEEKESRQREDMMDKCALGEEEYITLLMDNMFTRMVDTVSSLDYVRRKEKSRFSVLYLGPA